MAKRPRRSTARSVLRLLVWVLGIPAVLLVVLYVALLIRPIPLAFLRAPVLAAIDGALPPSANLEMGDMALALEGGVLPVLQFSPVTYTDTRSGARVEMRALEVGFSPVRALFGQPGATVTVVGPHIQVIQDLLGPRLSNFELVTDPQTGQTTVRVLEGEEAFPAVEISAQGLDVQGNIPASVPPGGLRSDNDWLIYNIEATEKGLKQIVEQGASGVFSRLMVRDGVLDMNDSVYGFLRHFTDVTLDISPVREDRPTVGLFSAAIGGQVMNGRLERAVEKDGSTTLSMAITNIDLGAIAAVDESAAAMPSVKGSGSFSADFNFQGGSGAILSGRFHVDLTGTDVFIAGKAVPILSSILQVDWNPRDGTFAMDEAELHFGNSSAKVSGLFVLGLDENFGPTVAMSVSGRDIVISPDGMAPPEKPFEKFEFSGWSAPLYGAMGIDRMRLTKGESWVSATGRADMLRRGMGFDFTIEGGGVSADDLKRLWPSITADSSRDWFVDHITAGTVTSAKLKFAFPVGTLPAAGEEKPLPANAISIDMVGDGVVIKPTDTVAPIAIKGNTRLQLRDGNFSVAADGGQLATSGGALDIKNAAFVIDSSTPGKRVMEISGDVNGGIPALIGLAKDQQPQALADAKLPIDLATLKGKLDLGLVATFVLGQNDALEQMDYVLNGTVADLGSSAAIQGRHFGNGQLAFSASQTGYTVSGTAEIDGLPVNVDVSGTPETAPNLLLSATLDAKDFAKMGFDISEFITGQLTFAAQPQADGSLKMAVDLAHAALNIKDIGISKPSGAPGVLEATIKQDGKSTDISDINLGFGTVRLQGALSVNAEAGLESAEFTNFGLSPGDSAQLSLTPIRDGYSVRIRGAQLDLKPMLQRFFGLGEGAGGVQTSSFKQAIVLDVQLDRALGFYKTTAFNVDLDLALRGTDLQKAALTAELGNGRSIAITTNPAPEGRSLSVAFNDFGTVLRLLGIYPQLEGGDGSLVMTTNTKAKIDVGLFVLNNFAIIDEDMVGQLLGNQGGREAIAARKKLEFKNGQVNFVRSADQVEIQEAMLAGPTVGGTARGFIYTKSRQYDLVGTFIPLFGLNSAFGKLPLLGPLLGGRDGEGLLGVTFAVRGPLEQPEFKINPASMLAVGAFRSLFEFKTKGEQQSN